MFKFVFVHLHLPPKIGEKNWNCLNAGTLDIESVVFSLTWSTEFSKQYISELHEYAIENEGFWIFNSASDGREKELRNVTTAEFHKQAPRHQGRGKL